MALQTHQCLLAIVLAVLAIPAAPQSTVDYGGGYLLGDCRPLWASAANGTAFRASLAPLLAALPSAAAPTGFASLRSADGRAFARAFCYGGESHDCRKCLSTALAWTWICNGSQRAAFWNAGCFLAYGDTNASSASEDEKAFWRFDYDDRDVVANRYPEFYDVQQLVDLAQSLAPRAANGSSSGGRMLAMASVAVQANSTVRVLAQCPGNVTAAADCARCLEESARELSERLRVQAQEHDGVQSAGVANVFRYNCYLRLEISAPLPMGKGARLRRKMKEEGSSCRGGRGCRRHRRRDRRSSVPRSEANPYQQQGPSCQACRWLATDAPSGTLRDCSLIDQMWSTRPPSQRFAFCNAFACTICVCPWLPGQMAMLPVLSWCETFV